MEKEQLISKQGYPIFCCNQISGEDAILLICHGFGSSKESPMVQALGETMPGHGFGTYSFDFPSHGESTVSGPALRIQNCLDDLATVEAELLRRHPGRKLLYFGSSFGAYIILLYLALYPYQGEKAFLRSSAVRMGDIVESWLTQGPPIWHPSPDETPMHDYFTLDYDYQREMQITRACLKDLKEFDVFAHYPRPVCPLFMVHGGADGTAPLADAEAFARLSGATLHPIPDGDHRLMGPGQLERILDLALGFFLREA